MNTPLRQSLETTIGSARRLSEDRHAALLSLCRLLADQIDAAGDEASARLTAAYLSALKDVQRVLGDVKTPEATGKLAALRGDASRLRPVTSPAHPRSSPRSNQPKEMLR